MPVIRAGPGISEFMCRRSAFFLAEPAFAPAPHGLDHGVLLGGKIRTGTAHDALFELVLARAAGTVEAYHRIGAGEEFRRDVQYRDAQVHGVQVSVEIGVPRLYRRS